VTRRQGTISRPVAAVAMLGALTFAGTVFNGGWPAGDRPAAVDPIRMWADPAAAPADRGPALVAATAHEMDAVARPVQRRRLTEYPGGRRNADQPRAADRARAYPKRDDRKAGTGRCASGRCRGQK